MSWWGWLLGVLAIAAVAGGVALYLRAAYKGVGE